MEPIIFASANQAMNDTQAKHTSSSETLPVALAKRRAPSFRELAASNGAYTGSDLVWHIPVSLYQDSFPDPKPGDYILDGDGIQWTILPAGVALNALKSTWKCFTRNLVLTYQLYDLIDIQRAGITYDVAGGLVRTWPDDPVPAGSFIYRGIAAKVQLLTQDVKIALGVLGLEGNYAVYVIKDLNVSNSDRVVWYTQTGKVYLDIIAQHNPQRIDELPVLDCSQNP